MTDSIDPLDHAPEPDDRPVGMAAPAAAAATSPAPAVPAVAAPVPYRPKPSGWARVFRWWLGLSVLAFLGVALCVWIGVGHGDFAPMHIVIADDGSDGITINGLTDAGGALLAVGACLLTLLLLLLIPLLILIVVGSVAIAVICGVGVPLIALALALAVVTSPIWVVGLLIWLAARRRDTNRLAASATMPA
jgi:hypothetical protein